MAEQKQAKTQKAVLLSDSLIKPEQGLMRRMVACPLAFLFHASLVVSAVIIPLLNTTNLPSVEVYSAFLAPPSPPAPPAPPPPQQKSPGKKKTPPKNRGGPTPH